MTTRDLKLHGAAVNTFSGRGNIESMETMLNQLNHVFFAPRWKLSRFQVMMLQPLMRKGDSKKVRQEIAAQYGKHIAMLGVQYAALMIMGGLSWAVSGDEEDERSPVGAGDWKLRVGNTTVSLAMTSSDFLKVKTGRHRIDIMSGMQQTMVFMSRLATGKYTSSVTGETVRTGPNVWEILNGIVVDPEDRDMTAGKIIVNYLRSASSPLVGHFVDTVLGRDFTGREATLYSEAAEGMIMLTATEVWSVIGEQLRSVNADENMIKGVVDIFALTALIMAGEGVSTYGPDEDDRKRLIGEAVYDLTGERPPRKGKTQEEYDKAVKAWELRQRLAKQRLKHMGYEDVDLVKALEAYAKSKKYRTDMYKGKKRTAFGERAIRVRQRIKQMEEE